MRRSANSRRTLQGITAFLLLVGSVATAGVSPAAACTYNRGTSSGTWTNDQVAWGYPDRAELSAEGCIASEQPLPPGVVNGTSLARLQLSAGCGSVSAGMRCSWPEVELRRYSGESDIEWLVGSFQNRIGDYRFWVRTYNVDGNDVLEVWVWINYTSSRLTDGWQTYTFS